MASSKIVMVTGANTGIGYEIVKALLESAKSYHVFVGSRSLDKGNAAVEELKKECPKSSSTMEAIQLDLTSDESIEKSFDQVKQSHKHLDVLVNNAGASFDIEHVKGNVNLRESFNKAYDVNVAGTQVMSATYIPLLLKSSDPRLIFVGGLSNITTAAEKYFPTPDLPAGWPKKLEFETISYRSSKLAMNMIMLDWNHKLKADGVKVWSVGPGMLATNLGGFGAEKAKEMGAGHPSAGGKVIKAVVEGERDADVGKFISKDGGFIPW